VLALTVITSLTDEQLPEVGLTPSVRTQVERLARHSAACGCHGVVASANEAAFLKVLLPSGSLVVTPGIQLPATAANDQARIATPQLAARAGSSHIIVGRTITAAKDPVDAIAAVAQAFAQ